MIFPRLRTALDGLNKAQTELQAKYGGENGRKRVAISNSFQGKADQNNLDIYNGKTTWGTYNKQRRDLLTQMNAML